LFDLEKCIQLLSEHCHFVQGIAWDPQSMFLASQSSDRSLNIYSFDASKPQPATLLAKHTKLNDNVKLYHDEDLISFFRRPSFSPDGALLISPCGISPANENTAYIFTRASIRQ
jgi:chromatin assembly factor 1 subunit B